MTLAPVLLAAALCVAPAQEGPPQPLAAADLEAMVEPIALYPDALLANVLAAAVYPLEIVKAGRVAGAGTDPAVIDGQDWEPPVKAVAKVPVVIQMMSDKLDWTEALGQAYLADAQGVMAAVQRLREKAYDNGALTSGQEVTVVEDGTTIVIESASSDVVYVPIYEPGVVYPTGSLLAAGAVTFGAGVLVGAAFDDLDCDWHHGDVCWGGDVDIDVDNNFKYKNEVSNTFERNTDIARGDAPSRPATRPGREGTAWRPNQEKIRRDGAAAGRPGTGALDKFRGIGGDAGPRDAIPRHPQAGTLPAGQAGRPGAATRPAGATGARSTRSPAARPSSGARRQSFSGFANRPSPAAAAPAHRPSPPSGFSPSRGAQRSSARGARSAGGRGGRRGR